MDIRSLSDIRHWIEKEGIAEDREAYSLARWVSEDILHLKSGEQVQHHHVDKIIEVIHRLKRGEPIQYIAGHAWFYGYKFLVSPDVLIPRPETEELTAWLIEEIKNSGRPQCRVLDIGTGSGCIALTIKKKLGHQVAVTGIDISEKALRIADKNSAGLGAEASFIQMDFLTDTSGLEPFDYIISNPPYVSRSDIPESMQEALRYEPKGALYPEGEDVDIFYMTIAHRGRELLSAGGAVYVELNQFRAVEIEKLFADTGWRQIEVQNDMQGVPRMLRAIVS